MTAEPTDRSGGVADGDAVARLFKQIPVVAFDHTAIGVWSVERALTLYRDVMGGVVCKEGHNRRSGYHFLQLRYPNRSKLELLEPLDPEDTTNFLVRFLKSRGEGVHHLTYYISSLDQALEAAEAAGLKVVGIYRDNPGWREAFIYPTSAHGTVVQLAETDASEWQ